MTTTRVLMSGCWLGLTDPKGYVCPLGADIQGVARRELREDESARGQALRQLQDWISKNRDLHNCRTDPCFLLRFLRVKKFSVPMAQQMLLKYLYMRQMLPHLCLKLDFLSPAVNEIIENGYVFPSPVRDRHGRRVVLTFANRFDPYKHDNKEMAKAHMVTYETLLEDEECQVMGFTHVGDLRGVSAAHVTLWSPREFTTLIRWGEQSYPMRHKEIHLVNVPTALRYVYDFARSRFSNKMRTRFMIHNSIEELHQKIDPQILPKEMGGDIPMKEMIEAWKHELLAKRERLLALDDMKLLDPKDIKSTSTKTSKQSVDGNALSGSFRKLEVD
ncbi:clavesin-2 [Macrosteles quadrilineatus]|uniref:clavesin-2 n=1 Tax=Macrosteles quadrilineatus TaxID=74068 RepID=UPI0023E22439|nr:clavesin-2 [Macrosteles quadrilineatus]